MFSKAPIRRAAPRLATKRRALVLTDEAARHPFRANLPAHVREPIDDATAADQGKRLSGSDWRQALNTYCGGFVAVTTFIS